ncbi:MAG: hypothetical protein FJ335_00625 [Sphingomonadales bacterium]|nr:hypothetical protein [Sphingomonadales bacterium]
MIVDCGSRLRLDIDGVFSGTAGVADGRVSFVPNRFGKSPAQARAGVLDGVAVTLAPVKDATGPFWTSRYEVLS